MKAGAHLVFLWNARQEAIATSCQEAVAASGAAHIARDIPNKEPHTPFAQGFQYVEAFLQIRITDKYHPFLFVV